ncbi:hypothetical protein M407DRAFT_26905 [Tulasnella calospora MUT 4182]|uniref:Uncharacterized protein n=1 Tax=Tulasnella calospora MUT 4182 TaxID=1051891 RepID=A0A0C3LQA5_9AGAM|nr:hypothetical protein M407DRAFT_26905 [Tulasnella calospora MUT 4182]
MLEKQESHSLGLGIGIGVCVGVGTGVAATLSQSPQSEFSLVPYLWLLVQVVNGSALPRFEPSIPHVGTSTSTSTSAVVSGSFGFETHISHGTTIGQSPPTLTSPTTSSSTIVPGPALPVHPFHLEVGGQLTTAVISQGSHPPSATVGSTSVHGTPVEAKNVDSKSTSG